MVRYCNRCGNEIPKRARPSLAISRRFHETRTIFLPTSLETMGGGCL